MKIDLHCHTKKVKTGDALSRNVTAEKFCEKIIEADIKIVAITNHNYFDYIQYNEFKKSVDGNCDIWPGIELDIWCGTSTEEKKRGHLIVISNPKNTEKFSDSVNKLLGNKKPDDFITDVRSVYEAFKKCDCIYIPHYHKKPGFSDDDIQELSNMLEDKSRLFKETSDYRSLGVFSNFDYSMIIGSDVQDWETYEKCTFADIRLPIQTFEQFCLLSRKDIQVINTLLNKKMKKEITVSPCTGVSFRLPFYNDINIIFGQKGTGKSEIITSLRKFCVESGISFSEYIGNEKESDFSKLTKTDKVIISPEKMGIASLEQEFQEIYEWGEELPTALSRYVSWFQTKDNNKNKGRMKITESVHLEEPQRDRKLEQDYKSMTEFTTSSFSKIDFLRYLSEDEKRDLFSLLDKLCNQVNKSRMEKWNSDKSVKLTNWSIDKIKSIADKCSDTISKPSSTGFYEFALNRLKLLEVISTLEEAFEAPDCLEKEYLGRLEDKGDVYIQTRFRMLKKESRKDEFTQGIQELKKCRTTISKIGQSVFSNELSEVIDEFKIYYEDGIKNISSFIGVIKEVAMSDGSIYKPSNGERGILLMQRSLTEENDVYLLDEPELGMGNSYITSTIVPRLIDLAKQRKMVVIATHNANIAVGTLPYASVLRTHENGVYKTYLGNPFCDELVNIEDNTDIKNWTMESMHTLEGGRDAFYDRKDIYESGRKNN